MQENIHISIRLSIMAAAMLLVFGGIESSTAQNFSNHIYQIIYGPLTWNQAKADAEARGGHLATITSQAEAEYIQSLGILPADPFEAFWLGASDEAQEGIWTWVTGEPFAFAAWAGGEPNNLGEEDYLVVRGTVTSGWNDWGRVNSTMPQYLLEIDNSYCPPRRARATLQVVNGFVVGAMVVDSGCGYTNAPTVLIRGGDGNGATATATITDGRVASINISTTGCCYTGTPRIEIASPPFLPTLSVGVSRIRVTQNVVLGRKYVLESSTNMTHWLPTAPAFTAESETLQNEFDGEPGGRFFRIREVP